MHCAPEQCSSWKVHLGWEKKREKVFQNEFWEETAAVSYIRTLHISGKTEQEQAEPEHVILTERVHHILPSPKLGF